MLKNKSKVSSSTSDDKTQFHLMERVKELTCLYDIARIAADTSLSIENMLKNIVGVLPGAWRHPNDAFAKIIFDNRIYSTPNYPPVVRSQRSALSINGRQRGSVEVSYPKRQDSRDMNPFLDEEQKLLDTVAREVSAMIRRRETEQDKLKLEDQLRHADRLATIGQLCASVAHELNEPLGHILGFAELVKKCPGLPAQAMADNDKILATSLHAREVVKQLLIFSRQTSQEKTKVNLNNLIKQGLTFLESRCAGEGIKLQCRLGPDVPEIDAAPAQMSQVFISLMVNAIQAMPDGGTISIRTRRAGGKVSLVIEDNGIGMNDDVLQKIFIPFFTTKEADIGTGLGLPVVHDIITGHKGSIKIESKVGTGTKCRIQLPV